MDTRRVSGGEICVSPAQGHKKCISAIQNLRFACAKHSVGLFSLRRATQNASPELTRGSRPDCFPCAGPHKTRLRRSKFAFRLRRATKSDEKDAIRHESETWILQKLLRYMDVETWIRRHGSCRGS